MISIRFRRLYRLLSYLIGVLRCFRPGMQGRIPLSFNASRNQSASQDRFAPGRHSRTPWPLYDLLQPVCSLGEAGCPGPDIPSGVRCLRGVRAIRGQFVHPRPPARGERKKGGEAATGPAGLADLRAVCMGRSRGGLTTRIHAVTDTRGLPITLKPTAGQAHDGRSADDKLGTVGPGRTLLADAVHDSNRCAINSQRLARQRSSGRSRTV